VCLCVCVCVCLCVYTYIHAYIYIIYAYEVLMLGQLQRLERRRTEETQRARLQEERARLESLKALCLAPHRLLSSMHSSNAYRLPRCPFKSVRLLFPAYLC
jgi:hypothetical protein